MNMHQRFQANPLGLDSFGAWMRHYEKLHAQFPLGCTKVSEGWLDLWDGLGELLAMDVEVASSADGVGWHVIGNGDLAECLRQCIEINVAATRGRYRIRLLDGTIIKEWGPR